ncbi:hypothetical protein E4191_06205 [Paracoccus liaowanqingii]|uniref:Endonuclease/exonuclease/phosphatase domain-containing protein n=1 Tax=Paracoccus liaowanqingii TaxID=2560053 RepID=A0A4P7HJM0_9RHOB|nr:endonuclease/exonuclease/phosphatase family protein [Paracoccus liaowanqingii]QBX34349.1 hypothetical protein E4191_06205 [Paracoccus liaowanqingii]
MGTRADRIRKAAAVITLTALSTVATASLLPLARTNAWWVRFLDFPRWQFSVALIGLLLVFLLLARRTGWIQRAVILGAMAGLGHHGYKLLPYSGLAEPAASLEPDCAGGQSLRIMSANVKRRNETTAPFLAQVAAVDPDLLLVMETDAWWDGQLTTLAAKYPHRVQNIPEDDAFYGMHFLSKHRLISPEFRFLFDADTPTLVTQIQLPDDRIIDIVGLHPRPPLPWSQPTTMRDAHLLAAALVARRSETATILTGDFNAVPWERVTRRAIRLGGLVDPRVGRGLHPTYDTNGPKH